MLIFLAATIVYNRCQLLMPGLFLLSFFLVLFHFFFLFVTSSLVTWDEIEGQSRGVGHEMAETVCQWELGRMDEPEL